MPEVVELREVTDRRDVIHRAVQCLSSGELVALPSEAGYVLAGAALVESGTRFFGASSRHYFSFLGSRPKFLLVISRRLRRRRPLL